MPFGVGQPARLHRRIRLVQGDEATVKLHAQNRNPVPLALTCSSVNQPAAVPASGCTAGGSLTGRTKLTHRERSHSLARAPATGGSADRAEAAAAPSGADSAGEGSASALAHACAPARLSQTCGLDLRRGRVGLAAVKLNDGGTCRPTDAASGSPLTAGTVAGTAAAGRQICR